jgi:magnesium-transporting ATPase (P-type)
MGVQWRDRCTRAGTCSPLPTPAQRFRSPPCPAQLLRPRGTRSDRTTSPACSAPARKKAILLLFSTSIAEVAVLVLAMALGYPAPFAAVQILWNNLVTEGLITVNLALEPPEGDEMTRPPIRNDERLLTRDLLWRVVVMVTAITLSTVGWFIYRTESGAPAAQVQTETFTLLAICEWFNVLNCRSATRTALSWNVLANRWLVGGLVVANALQVAVVFWAPLGALVHAVPFGLEQVLALAVVGSLVLWAEELRKLIARRASHGEALEQ